MSSKGIGVAAHGDQFLGAGRRLFRESLDQVLVIQETSDANNIFKDVAGTVLGMRNPLHAAIGHGGEAAFPDRSLVEDQ